MRFNFFEIFLMHSVLETPLNPPETGGGLERTIRLNGGKSVEERQTSVPSILQPKYVDCSPETYGASVVNTG